MHKRLPSAVAALFSRLPRARQLILLAAYWVCTTQASVFASVYNISIPGTWPGGRITWYYNPAGRPANITDAEIIDTVKAAFTEWNRVCKIAGTYGGLTTTPVSPVPLSTYVIGWTDFGSPQFHAKGYHRSTSASTTYAPFSGGGVQINVSNTEWRGILDAGTALGIFQHEIGHTLGLAHSDDPSSIMFANPYNTARYETMLQGDDIAACADLYGGQGMIVQPDLRNSVPVAGYSVQTSVLSAKPGSSIPAASLAQIDPVGGGPYYFDNHWQQLPLGSNVQSQWVTPYGSVYQRFSHATTVASGNWYYTFPNDGILFPYAGRWAFQAVVDGKLATSVPFEVLRGSVASAVPFEAAALGERDAAGNLNWSVVPYGYGSPTKLRVVANGQPAAGTTTVAQSGSNATEVWMETDRPRYKLDQDDGQPSHSYDVMRRAVFSASLDGTPTPSAPSVLESGTPSAYAASATISLNGAGDYGIYVTKQLGGQLYYRLPTGWSDRAGALVTARGPAVAVVDLVRNFDTRSLSAGAQFCVGYGAGATQMSTTGNVQLIGTVADSIGTSASSESCLVVAPQTGMWWNPAQGGRGFEIEQQGNTLFFGAFMYDGSGRSTWYAASGTVKGNVFSSTLETYANGQTLTGPYKAPVVTGSAGPVSITFSDASHATLTWPGGTIPIQRFDVVAGGTALTPPAGTPESGIWWNTAENGRGFALEIQGGVVFLGGYMFDTSGNPVWYSSGPTAMSDSKTYVGKWEQYGNGQTLSGPYKAPAIVNGNVGSVRIDFSGTQNATLTLPDGRKIPITRFKF